MHRFLLSVVLLFSAGVAQPAGMDDDTSRLTGSSYEKTSPTSRFATPNGSTTLDNGMIVKWGEATVVAPAASTTVTFSAAFPSNILSVEVAVVGGALSGTSATVSGISKTAFTANIQCFALTGPIVCATNTTIKWSARGY